MFYTFMQNNSGGYYLRDENVEEVVIIEANDAEEAARKLWEIVEDDYLESCECCGDRWNVLSEYHDGEYETPKIFGDDSRETTYSHIIYYANGAKVRRERG